MKKTNKQANKTVSEELLESCRQALYQIKNTFDELVNNKEFVKLELSDKLKIAENIIRITSGLGKSIETLGILEKKVQSEEQINSKIRGNAKPSLLEEGQI
jgi:hypothetical protein